MRSTARYRRALQRDPISLALACFLVGLCAGVTLSLIGIGMAHGGLAW